MTNCPEDPFLFTRQLLCCNFKREILNVGEFEQWWVAVQRTLEHASQSFQHLPCTMRSLYDPFTSNVSPKYSRLSQTEKENAQTNISRLPNHFKSLQLLWWPENITESLIVPGWRNPKSVSLTYLKFGVLPLCDPVLGFSFNLWYLISF